MLTETERVVVTAISALAAGVGVMLITKNVQAAQISSVGSTTFTALITDPTTVTQYQSAVAQVIATGSSDVPSWSAQPPMYTAADVDGNPKNPKWMAALAAYQVAMNGMRPWKGTPVGFPSALRTDGVLDYATAIALNNS